MKIIFNRQSISDSISPLMSTVSNKSTKPAVEGILIDAKEDGTCILTTFDEELDAMMAYNPAAVCIHGELADDLYYDCQLDAYVQATDPRDLAWEKKYVYINYAVHRHGKHRSTSGWFLVNLADPEQLRERVELLALEQGGRNEEIYH